MKPVIQHLSLTLFSALLLAGCGGSDNKSVSDDEKGTRMLEKNTSLKGTIAPVADVDWYTIDMQQPGIVALKVYNETLRYDVDMLATVYEQDNNGEFKRLAADHFAENSASSSTLNINVNITSPKTLYIAVRDLDDNDESNTETYSISYDVAAPEDNNGTFENATPVIPGGGCHTDSIGTVGDIDVMHFTLSNSGVVEMATNFSEFAGGSTVELKISLFNSEGTLVRSVNNTVDGVYRLVESLAAGSYYLLVYDQGKDDFDTASPFTSCVTNVAAAEVSVDDTQATATSISGNGHFDIAGSLDYAGDQDWNRFQSGATPPSIQVLQVEFDPSESNGCNSWYLLEITDSNDEVLFSKEYSTETGPRTAHIKVESSGEHFVSVSAVDDNVCRKGETQGMPYTATVDVVNVTDDVEMNDGNNTITNALELDENANQTTSALLSYIGDVDWYHIPVATSNQDRVLEIFVDTENPTNVEYYINVFLADQIVDSFTARESADHPMSYKTSVLIPSAVGNTTSDYFVKIVDLQSDEADIDNNYRIRTNIHAVQTQAPAISDDRVSGAVYFSETDEQTLAAGSSNELTLVVDASDHRTYGFNDTAFSVTAANQANLVTADTAGTLTVTFPWQSGYIDYDKDRDWYQLNLPAIYTAAGGTASTWYSEIKIELYSPAPGSLVEYAWGLFRDSSNNFAVSDGQGDDGFFASQGDISAEIAAVDLSMPAADATGPMWVNSDTASVPFYLAVTDILNQSTNLADNDWGYDQAYYVHVSVVFHSDMTRPAE